MNKLSQYWKSISVWQKAAYSSLAGILVWFLLGVINTAIVILKNKTGIYNCTVSVENSCGLAEYIFKSDYSFLFYISIMLVFGLLLIVTNILALLTYLHRKDDHHLFWITLAIITIIVIVSPLIVSYLQFWW